MLIETLLSLRLACTSRNFKPIGGVISAHCTGDFAHTNSGSTSSWPVKSTACSSMVQRWDNVLRHRLPWTSPLCSASLHCCPPSCQPKVHRRLQRHDTVEYTDGSADYDLTEKDHVMSNSGGAPCVAFERSVSCSQHCVNLNAGRSDPDSR